MFYNVLFSLSCKSSQNVCLGVEAGEEQVFWHFYIVVQEVQELASK